VVIFWLTTLIATVFLFSIAWTYYWRAKKEKTSWSEVFWIAIAADFGLFYIFTEVVQRLGLW